MRKNQISAKVTTLIQQGNGLAAQLRANILSLNAAPPELFAEGNLWEQTLQQQGHLSDRLDVLVGKLKEAERARILEAADDHEPRRRRDEAHEALYDMTVKSKQHLESALGAGSSARYGLGGTTGRKSAALILLVENALDLLISDPQQRSDHFGASADTAAIVAALQPLKSALEEVIATVAREAEEYPEALLHRDEVFNTLRASISYVLNSHVTLLELCDRDDLIHATRSLRESYTRRTSNEEVEATTPTA